MILAILFLLVLLIPNNGFSACTGPPPNWSCAASTTTFADINSLMGGSPAGWARGDTITVTGSGTFDVATFLNLTKGVKIIGPNVVPDPNTQGTGTLFFRRDGHLVEINPDATAIANEEIIQVTGLGFDGNNGTIHELFAAQGSTAGAAKPFKNLIITHNYFKNLSQSSSNRVFDFHGQIRGVIGNNDLDRPNDVGFWGGNDDIAEFSNAAFFPVTLGDSDCLYFETNRLHWSSSSTAVGWVSWMESGQGGRICSRYNVIDMTGATKDNEKIDVHGGQGAQTGTMKSEYYGNTYIDIKPEIADGGSQINARGGKNIFINNIFLRATGHTGTTPGGENNIYTGGCDIQRGVTGIQLNNTYWVNTHYGNSATPTSGTPLPLSATNVDGAPCGAPVQDSWWWQEKGTCTSSSCSSGVGKGTTAPSGTCSVGVGYWVEARPSTVYPISVTNTQAGTLYKCTATNVWTPFWTPYTYPHPLISGSTPAPGLRFSPTLNLRIAELINE